MAIKFSVKDQPKSVPAKTGAGVRGKATLRDEGSELIGPSEATPAASPTGGIDLFDAAPKPAGRKRRAK